MSKHILHFFYGSFARSTKDFRNIQVLFRCLDNVVQLQQSRCCCQILCWKFSAVLKERPHVNHDLKVLVNKKSHVLERSVFTPSIIPKRDNSKRQQKGGKSDSDAEDSDDESDDDNDSLLTDLGEEDPNVPKDYRQMIVHTTRADSVVAKSLGLKSKESETMFYKSRFYYRGKVLTKKARKIEEGSYIDIIEAQADIQNKSGKIKIQRVKVLKYFKKTTRTGKPITAVRFWKRPFEVDVISVIY